VTPQDQLTILAAIEPRLQSSLRATLEAMNAPSGMADPANNIVPFGAFERLHFARFVILEDPTLADIEAYGIAPPQFPTYLGFIGDCDGPAHTLLEELCTRAEAGLRQIFSHCSGFDTTTKLIDWLLAHVQPAAATYVNYVGRTVTQIREESALQRALATQVARPPQPLALEAERQRLQLRDYVRREVEAGRLTLTPASATPFGWALRRFLHAVAIPLASLLVTPALLVLAPFVLARLRRLERTDPEICPRPALEGLSALQAREDIDVSNQYTALGSLKPGLLRRVLMNILLIYVNYFARHLFTRGFLARVQTIHFARWVPMDGGSRMLFASNYDGGHEAYMDDFINKVAWGLNLVFSHGVGWPRTDWLLLRGARREHLFKYFQRRHQVPTQVWYKAYPGLTLTDLERNQQIRRGLERQRLSDSEALAWLRLL
jgi:hypothetical protein